MIQLHALLLGLLPFAAPTADDEPIELPQYFAVRVGEAHTVSHGTIEHAVILVENGRIVVVGEDLAIERGIPVFDRPDWVAIPGLVNCQSRLGLDGRGRSGFNPQRMASGELYPGQLVYADVLEHGTTTVGLHPAGNGIPGQAVAIRPAGSTPEDMILRDSAYLLIELRSNQGSKKMLSGAFDKVDKYLEKELKAFEKYEKDKEKAEKEKDKDKKKEMLDKLGEYVPPAPDDDELPFLQLREGELRALIDISKAADWLHLLDAIDDEEFDWDLRVGLRNDIDVYHVIEQIGEAEKRVVVEPRLTLVPNTRRERNLPAEFLRAGAKVAFVPTSPSSIASHESWRFDVGLLVAAGMSADDALRAMTLEPAAVLGVDAKVGSIEAGKHANLVFLDGDPFEPSTRIQAVLLEGELVHGEVNP
jgi:hypothetical protein